MENELIAMCDMLEAKATNNSYEELIETARYTAEFNPVSETAYDLRDDLMIALRDNR